MVQEASLGCGMPLTPAAPHTDPDTAKSLALAVMCHQHQQCCTQNMMVQKAWLGCDMSPTPEASHIDLKTAKSLARPPTPAVSHADPDGAMHSAYRLSR